MNLTPESLALLMGGANMMAASRGGNTDLTKGGLGYALQQGMTGALQGAQIGQGFEDARNKKQGLADFVKTLPPEARAQATAMLASGANPADILKVIGAKKFGQYDNYKDFAEGGQKLKSDYQKDVAPYRQRIQYYNDTLGLGDHTKWTGTDDFLAMRNLLKQSLPNESVMGDDLATLRTSQGLPGWAADMIAQLTGGGMQAVQARQNLLNTMYKNANTAVSGRNEIRSLAEGRFTEGGYDPSKYLLSPLNVSPLPSFESGNTSTMSMDQLEAEKRKLQEEIRQLKGE